MDMPAVLQLLKDRRDALNITIQVLEDEHVRHARVAKMTKRALRQAHAADVVNGAAHAVNGHGPARTFARGEKRALVLAALSGHPLKLADLAAKTGLTHKTLSVMLSTLQTKKMVARTGKGWVKK